MHNIEIETRLIFNGDLTDYVDLCLQLNGGNQKLFASFRILFNIAISMHTGCIHSCMLIFIKYGRKKRILQWRYQCKHDSNSKQILFTYANKLRKQSKEIKINKLRFTTPEEDVNYIKLLFSQEEKLAILHDVSIVLQ